MTPKNKYNNYVPYIIIAILLGVTLYGILHYNSIISALEQKVALYDGNQEKMETEFVQINDEYNAMMSTLSEKDQMLIESQQNLKELNAQLQTVLHQKKITEKELTQAKVLIAELKTRLVFENQKNELEAQIKALEEKNNKSEIEIKKYKDLVDKRESLITRYEENIKVKNELIRKGSTLRLINFDIKGVNVKASGREVETDKARKADKMRVSFRVNSNNISNSGDKELYLSLYNAEGKLAHFPDAQSGFITLQNGDVVEYTDFVKFHYEKGTSEEIQFDWENDDFQKGDYIIKVYENGILIGSETKNFR